MDTTRNENFIKLALDAIDLMYFAQAGQCGDGEQTR